MDWIDISTMIIPPQVINGICGEDARRFKVIPVDFGETGLVVAVGNPLDIDTMTQFGFPPATRVGTGLHESEKNSGSADQILRHGR